MEQRQEMKDAVKQRLIDMMVDKIAENEDFNKMKDELIAELLFTVPKEPKGRQMNSDEGYDPINEVEEMYKKKFGFIFNPKAIECRVKSKNPEAKITTSISDLMNKHSTEKAVDSPYDYNNVMSPSYKFRDKFPMMKEIINKEPSKEARELIHSLREKLNIGFTAAGVYNDLATVQTTPKPTDESIQGSITELAKPSEKDVARVIKQTRERISKNNKKVKAEKKVIKPTKAVKPAKPTKTNKKVTAAAKLKRNK